MAETGKADPRCPYHRAEESLRDLTSEWRDKAAALTPQAARSLAKSLRSLQDILDRRIHSLEQAARAEEKKTAHIHVKPDPDA